MISFKYNLNLYIACLGPYKTGRFHRTFPSFDGTLMRQRSRTLPLPTELSN